MKERQDLRGELLIKDCEMDSLVKHNERKEQKEHVKQKQENKKLSVKLDSMCKEIKCKEECINKLTNENNQLKNNIKTVTDDLANSKVKNEELHQKGDTMQAQINSLQDQTSVNSSQQNRMAVKSTHRRHNAALNPLYFRGRGSILSTFHKCQIT